MDNINEKNNKDKNENELILPGAKEIIKETKNAEKFDVVIEKERKALDDLYKKTNKESNIFMFVCVGLLVAGIILIAQKESNVMPIIGYVLMGLSILILIVHYIINKNKFPSASKKYVKIVTEILNGHIFTNSKFDELKVDELEKLEQSEILSDGVYNLIYNIGSRNVVRGTYDKHTFKIGDLAIYKAVNNRKKENDLLFIGKYVTYSNSLHFEGRLIFNVYNPLVTEEEMPDNTKQTKNHKIDLPNNIDDLVLLDEFDNTAVYGPKDVDYKKVVGTKFLDFIKSINVNKTLGNVNIAIWAGRTACYYSYDDDVIGLPFEKAFKGEPIDEFKKDLEQLMEGLTLINK